MFSRLRSARNWLWANTDSITKWLQVTALLFAAGWTYLIFKDTEAPSLETPLAVETDLQGVVLNQTTCELVAKIDINNPGLRTIAVDHVQARIWLIKDIPLKEGLNYVDLETVPGSPIYNHTPTSALNTQYPPKTHLSVGLVYIYSGVQSAGWYFLLRAEAFNSKGKRLGYAYALRRNICVTR
jgi:hypothetical protein